MPNLDEILRLLTWLSWLFFLVYAAVQFARTALRQGVARAVLLLLSARVLVPFLIVITISFISAALFFVPPTHVGVVVSMISPGGVRPQPLRAGLHLIVPILEQDAQYPIYWQTYTMSNKLGEGSRTGDDSVRARTRDGQEVRLDNSIIFRIDYEQAVTIHVDWQDRYIEEFIRPVIRGVVRTQVSQFTVQEVNSSSRKDLETTLDRLLRDELLGKGLIMDQFLLRDVTFTDDYAHSIEEKQIAQEGKERTMHEAEQVRNLAEGERDRLMTVAEGRKEQVILESEGRARAILLEATAQAEALALIADALALNPDLLTYEYINKLSPNIRAMLVPNDTPLILPLQDLVDNQTDAGSAIDVAAPEIETELETGLNATTPLTQTTAAPGPTPQSLQAPGAAPTPTPAGGLDAPQ